jgi:hypothetical protein
VVNFGAEVDFRRLEWVILREINVQEKHASRVSAWESIEGANG